MKSIYILSLILIIILSAFFRLGFMDSALFGGDEDSTACKILDFVNSHSLPPLLVKSHGVFTISTIDMLLYCVMSFVRDPRIIILLLIGIPNTAAVILCFLFCYKFIDKRTAIISTALFGFSNWAIIYSKSLWGVNTLQFFSILTFYILTIGICRSKSYMVILSILLLPFLPNLHLTSFSIFISVFLILISYYYKANLKYLLLTAIALIASIPILIYCIELDTRFLLDTNIVASFYTLNAMLTTINLIVRGVWYYLYLYVSPRYPHIENFSGVFLETAFIFGCVYLIKKMFQDIKMKRYTAHLIIGMWYFVFIVLFGFIDLTNHAHYFMVVLPSLFIITSIGFFSLIDYISGKNKIQNWELLLLFFMFLLWSPLIAILIILIVLFLKKLPPRVSVYTLYSLIIFILVFQAFSNIQLFNKIEKEGGVPGRASLDLGSKVKAVEFVVNDAQNKFKETGERSYCSIVDDEFYEYLFNYLIPKGSDFISREREGRVYHYIINGYADNFKNQDMLINSLYYKKIASAMTSTPPVSCGAIFSSIGKFQGTLYYKRIGTKLVIAEKISETEI